MSLLAEYFTQSYTKPVLLSKVHDDVSDEVSLFLQLVVGHHGHDFVIILSQVEVPILPLR